MAREHGQRYITVLGSGSFPSTQERADVWVTNSKKAGGGNMQWTFYYCCVISIFVNKNIFAITRCKTVFLSSENSTGQ